MSGEKWCRRCGKFQPVSMFHRHSGTRDGLGSWCSECHKRKLKAWHKQNPSKQLEAHLRKEYRLSLWQYRQLLKDHGNKCAVCGGNERLCIDHCHGEGHVRGLLCSNCNTALGLLADDPERIRALANYIESDPRWRFGKQLGMDAAEA